MLRKISAVVLTAAMLATGCAGAATYTERDAALGLSEEYVAGMTEFYSLTTTDPESGKGVTLSWAELENGGYIDTEAGTEAGNLTFLNADGEEVSVSDGDVWDEPVFKDLNRNGSLDTYEDWRLSSEERAQGLVDLLAGDEIWTLEDGRAPEGLFQLFGLTLENGGEAPTTITVTDATRDQIMNLGVRGILYGGSWSQDTEEDALLGLTMLTAIWNNDVQATAEAEPYGIPVNINSDPRHSASSGAEYEIDNQPDGELSYWPSNIGLAATFNPKYVLDFGKYSSIELRAMGITTALNPQSDLSTEPRWARVSGSYGEGSKLASDLVTAFTNGYQSTYGEDGEDLGWGEDSVAVITKHFPGDGAASDGREGHGAKGKFRVYPGDNFEYHTSVFLDALTLGTSEVGDDFSASGQTKEETIGEGQTETVSGMMTDYPATWDGETQYTEIGRWGEVLYFSQYGQQVATSYSEWMINNYLRELNGFEGIVVTDWGVTGSMSFRRNNIFGLESYNYYELFTSSEEESDIAFLEKLFAAYPEFDNAEYFDVAYQQFLILDAGVDQFGGNQDANYVAVAFQLKIDDLLYENPEMTYEEAYAIALEDYKTHAYRSVLAMFNVGLFENPYLDRWESYDAVGTNEANAAGYEAILASIVMIKNSDNVIHDRSEELEAGEKLVVYIPYTYTPASEDWDGNATAATINTNTDVTTELTSQYITVVGDSISEDADPDNLTYDDIIRRTDFEGVDFALVMVSSPEHEGYGAGYSGVYPDGEYVPISLQYGEYTADGRYVKTEQPAYDPLDPVGEDETTRTYYGKSVTVGNSSDLDTILETVEMVEPHDVPVVLVMSTSNPFVPAEFEPYVDAILLSFNATNQAIFEVLAGSYEPQGLLPFQLPRDMDEVERQLEDTPFDMIPYEDADGNSYDYAFGLNWSGEIDDWRTERYGLTCDRTPLLKLIVDEVDDVLYGDTSAYTESSIQALEEAKAAAYEQINEPWNTQENIDAAYDALYNAFTNLEAQ